MDLSERGGAGATSDTRLFMQLLVYTDVPCDGTDAPSDSTNVPSDNTDPLAPLRDALDASASPHHGAVLYEAVNDPRGVGVLTWSTDPQQLVDATRAQARARAFAALTPLPSFTMLGRSYTIGYERDLDETLLHRPTRTALNPDWPWVVWYPLRRAGAFNRLPDDEQKEILKEHGTIGMRFGGSDHAHDIRLACHGLDPNDNDFVIGLTGKALAPLSQLVQTMRGTVQTSQYLEKLGPFFVARAVHHVPASG